MSEQRFTRLKFSLIAILSAAAFFVQAAGPSDSGDARTRAVSALEEDIKTDPNNAELWLHLGFAYRKLEKIDQAQNAFEKVVALNPGSADPYFMLGLIYESKHQNAQAGEAWKKYLAAETNPEKRAIAEKHIHHLSQ